MQRLLMVDGSNLLFQMFYGMPARIIGRGGAPVHGTLGFIGAFIKLLNMVVPTHVLVIFDGEHENDRRTISPDYKANRTDFSLMEEADTPFSQLRDICRALDFMGIMHMETTDCEADDVIAAYALECASSMHVTIASLDSDFFQLISERVSVLRYRGKSTQLCDEGYVLDRFGIKSALYADYKALVGDSADNIRGARLIGPKTAAWLINEYGSLENIINSAAEISKRAVRESILESEARLRLNYSLIALNKSSELPIAPDRLTFTMPTLTSVQILKKLEIV